MRLDLNSESVTLNHSGCDINQKGQLCSYLRLPSKRRPLLLKFPNGIYPYETPAHYGETQAEGWTSKAANRISCCFITASLNQCHHMLQLAQRHSARLVPGRQLKSKRAKIMSEYIFLHVATLAAQYLI